MTTKQPTRESEHNTIDMKYCQIYADNLNPDNNNENHGLQEVLSNKKGNVNINKNNRIARKREKK